MTSEVNEMPLMSDAEIEEDRQRLYRQAREHVTGAVDLILHGASQRLSDSGIVGEDKLTMSETEAFKIVSAWIIEEIMDHGVTIIDPKTREPMELQEPIIVVEDPKA